MQSKRSFFFHLKKIWDTTRDLRNWVTGYRDTTEPTIQKHRRNKQIGEAQYITLPLLQMKGTITLGTVEAHQGRNRSHTHVDVQADCNQRHHQDHMKIMYIRNMHQGSYSIKYPTFHCFTIADQLKHFQIRVCIHSRMIRCQKNDTLPSIHSFTLSLIHI